MRSWKRFIARFARIGVAALVAISIQGCSIFHRPGGVETSPIYSKIYKTDYNTAWQAALDSLSGFDRTVVNREAGVVQTAWIDNTASKNFSDTYGQSEVFHRARYRLSVSVSPGVYAGRPAVKVSVQKEQMIQRELMEGWSPVETDEIEENTLLYRIGRVVWIKNRIKRIEDERTRRAFKEGV